MSRIGSSALTVISPTATRPLGQRTSHRTFRLGAIHSVRPFPMASKVDSTSSRKEVSASVPGTQMVIVYMPVTVGLLGEPAK